MVAFHRPGVIPLVKVNDWRVEVSSEIFPKELRGFRPFVVEKVIKLILLTSLQ